LESDQSWVPLTPNRTAALGLIYSQGPVQGSLIEKYVGVRYGDSEDQFRLNAYATADAAISYNFGAMSNAVKDFKVTVTAQNLTDRRSIYFFNGTTGSGSPLFFTLPGRSAQVSLSASF
jgi:iron complex outermembrane receptor protein